MNWNQKKLVTIPLAFFIGLLLISTPITVFGNQMQKRIADDEVGNWRIVVNVENNENEVYAGNVRVYVVEPTSRWNNEDGDPYHYGVLDLPIDEDIRIEDSYEKNITWNPEVVDGIDENNVMVIAAVYNATPYERYSYENRPFDAYFVDACAGAKPGNTGENTVTSEFSHTVFAEEATATWCPACPRAAEALNDIYESDDYPFYFVSLVLDQNKVAQQRGSDYNVYGIPVTFFDGGYEVYIGSLNVENEYRNRIEASGQRDVPSLDFRVTFYWDPDVEPPAVEITKPEPNTLYFFNEEKKEINKNIIIGTTDIKVSTSDTESNIEKVEFYINDDLREEDSQYPYSFSNWKESKFFGRYTIKVIAYDEAENQGVASLDVIRFF